MRRWMLALLALAAGTQLASAQGDGGDAGDISERLRDLDERLEAINRSNSDVLYASITVAGLAVLATVMYAVQLERQIRSSKKQLSLAEVDAEHRLRPALEWCMYDDRSIIKMTDSGVRPSGLSIRVINTGQVSAGDIVVHHNARLVGSGAGFRPRMRRLGALGPGKSIEIHIPMSAEDLASSMGGGAAYLEASCAYRDGAGKVLTYRVAGYRSSTVSTLFGEMGAVPHDGVGKKRQMPASGIPVPAGGRREVEPPARPAKSRKIQRAGSLARELAESQEPGDDMTRDEASRLLSASDDAIKGRPDSATAHRDRATALRVLERHEEALKAIGRAERADPASVMTLKEQSRILQGLGRHDAAIGALTRVLEMRGADLHACMELARLHTLLGEHDMAYAMWARITGQDPTYETYMRMAATCVALRQHGHADAALESAIGKRPGDAYAHAQRGIAQIALGQHEKAVPTLERAIKLDPGLADARVGLAHALYGVGREAEAADSLDLAVEADPGNQKAHIDRGVLMLEMGSLEEARDSFMAARRLDPSMLVPQVGWGPPGAPAPRKT